ncbi:MAG: hypothetical protein LBE80_08685 [Deltaproteobacteria bacterium]|jgi:transposase|nr:hypothetical protein [Deltaproteobacteria bacterium]
MTLDKNLQVPLPDGCVIVPGKGPDPAVYKTFLISQNQVGKAINKKVLIGKLDLATNKLIPNDQYWELCPSQSIEPAIESPHETGQSFGGEALFASALIFMGLNEILEKNCHDHEFIKSTAYAMAAVGNSFHDMLDFSEVYTLRYKPLELDSAPRYFANISLEERLGFFKDWLQHLPKSTLSVYDAISYKHFANDLFDDQEERFHAGRRVGLNVGMFVADNIGLPVCYVLYQGPRSKKSDLKSLMVLNKELGLKDLELVLREDFLSIENVKYLEAKGYDFIIQVPNQDQKLLQIIDQHRDSIRLESNLIGNYVQAISIKDFMPETDSSLNLYFSDNLAELRKSRLLWTIESKEEDLKLLKTLPDQLDKDYSPYFDIKIKKDKTFTYKRNTAAIDQTLKNAGFEALLSSANISPHKAFNSYSLVSQIEYYLENVNDLWGLKGFFSTPPNPYSSESITEGKLFCCFIALIVVTYLEDKLHGFLKTRGWDLKEALAELAKISLVTKPRGQKDITPLTDTQKEILIILSLSENDLRTYAGLAD